MKDMIIHIHNIYSLLSKVLQNIDRKFFIYYLQQALNKSDKHLLIKDFNIHYFAWEETRCMQQHSMTNNLIWVINKTELTLITFSNIIIRKFNKQLSTIDLVFVTAEICHRLMSCNVDWNLESRSDHYSIIMIICFKINMSTQK